LRPRDTAADVQVVEHVRQEIAAGRLGPGQRLPPERELAEAMSVSRPSLRSGLRTLQAMGIVTSRRGAGTFIVAGPPKLGKAPLQFLAALHGFTLEQMYEARRMLEVGAAGLAAERARGDELAAMADELTGMFASLEEPETFLRHDLGFHRAVAEGSGNPIVATIIGTLGEIIRETGPLSVDGFGLRESADAHRRIYDAIRAHSPERARHEMNQHLERACLRAKRPRRKGDRDGKETEPSQLPVLRGVDLVDGVLPPGVSERTGNARENHGPGPGHHQGAGPGGVRDRHGRGQGNHGLHDDQ
jgi:GntR family transcriptional repressor for pyruvate dehydrogenase complex